MFGDALGIPRGEQCERTVAAAAGERTGNGSRGGRSGRDARHNLDGHIGLPAGGDFLVGAAENGRIAALQPNHQRAVAGMGDQQTIDFALLSGCRAARLTDIYEQRFAARQFEDSAIDQSIVKNDVGGVEQLARFEG